jgi:hypothetical protein
VQFWRCASPSWVPHCCEGRGASPQGPAFRGEAIRRIALGRHSSLARPLKRRIVDYFFQSICAYTIAKYFSSTSKSSSSTTREYSPQLGQKRLNVLPRLYNSTSLFRAIPVLIGGPCAGCSPGRCRRSQQGIGCSFRNSSVVQLSIVSRVSGVPTSAAEYSSRAPDRGWYTTCT